ncbi:unnamed protein product [Rhizophagus irregularis]|nr:unnamed protein product [Rhizophagus irregularis]
MQAVRRALAEHKEIQPQEIPYPRSNVKLAKYRAEIQGIRDLQAEFGWLGNIDSNPHYEIVFYHRDQVKVGNHTNY